METEPKSSEMKPIDELSKRLLALKALQRDYVKIEMDFHQEFYALDMVYQQKRQHIYERRKEIVKGESEPTNEYPEDIVNDLAKSLQSLQLNSEGNGGSGIPKFWFHALKNCTYNDDLIHECDEDALSYLHDIRVNMVNNPEMSFTLEFEFAPNPYLANSVLTKQYFLSCDTEDEFCGFSIVRAFGCAIDWKENMSISDRETDTFFNFFASSELNANANPFEMETSTFLKMQQDFEIGLFIKEKLIPNAVLYYLNEVDELSDECGESGDNDESVVAQTNF